MRGELHAEFGQAIENLDHFVSVLDVEAGLQRAGDDDRPASEPVEDGPAEGVFTQVVTGSHDAKHVAGPRSQTSPLAPTTVG